MPPSPILCHRDKEFAKRKANEERLFDDERDDLDDIDEPLYERISHVVVDTIQEKRDVDGGQIHSNDHVMVGVENATGDAAKLDGEMSFYPSFKASSPKNSRVIISDNGVYR